MPRPPKCKNCSHYKSFEDGSCACTKLRRALLPEASAGNCDGKFFDRAKVSLGRISEVRRAASLSRKSFKGGRPPKDRSAYTPPAASVRVMPDDHAYLKEVARASDITVSSAVHLLVEFHRSRC